MTIKCHGFAVIVLLTLSWSPDYAQQESIRWKKCQEAQPNVCNIESVSVDPCKETPKPCKLKRGATAQISFNFTPGFSADRLITQAYGVVGFLDLPLVTMDPDGCKATACPLIAGSNSSLVYPLALSQYFPPSKYTVKWRLYNEKNNKQGCCFTFGIDLK